MIAYKFHIGVLTQHLSLPCLLRYSQTSMAQTSLGHGNLFEPLRVNRIARSGGIWG